MNDILRRKAVIRKVTYFGVILALFTLSMFWRGVFRLPVGDPDRIAVLDEKGRPVALSTADRVARLPIRYQADDLELLERDLGDPEVAGSLAQVSLVGIRGVVVTVLWNATINSQKRGEYDEMERTATLVTKLQPHFITPWIFQAWNISYNVSVETDKMGDQYYYIARGISLLAEGDRANTRPHRRGDKVFTVGSPDIRYQLGFFAQNKFSVSDKVNTLRSLSQLSLLPPDERDPRNYRVNRQANGAVDMDRFRTFCENNPQLVRRLKTNLNLSLPGEVIGFLQDNWKIPARYDVAAYDDQKGITLQPDDRAFPVLPVVPPEQEGGDLQLAAYLNEILEQEANPTAAGRDAVDMRMVARAWFEHAQTVVPPPKEGVASVSPRKDEYDPFRYRIPERPSLIVFRMAPPRAQNYVAERLQAEGWFDAGVRWNPDIGYVSRAVWFPLGVRPHLAKQLTELGVPPADAERLAQLDSRQQLAARLNDKSVTKDARGPIDVRWCPLKKTVADEKDPSDDDGVDLTHEEFGPDEVDREGKRVRPPNEVWLSRVRLTAGTNGRAEWEKTYRQWEEFGRKNGLRDVDRSTQEQLAIATVTAGLPPLGQPVRDYSDEELAEMGLRREHLNARRALLSFDQNRQVTNYQHFLELSLAEMEPDVARARQLFHDADELHSRNTDQELGERIKASALWRRVFASRKHEPFYQGGSSESLHEFTLAQELAVAQLLRKSDDQDTVRRTKALSTGLAAVTPGLAALTEPNVGRVAAQEEAQVRIALALIDLDPSLDLKRRAEEDVERFKRDYPNVEAPSVKATARGLLDGEFAWMKLYTRAVRPGEDKDNVPRWVSLSVRVAQWYKEGLIGAPDPSTGGLPTGVQLGQGGLPPLGPPKAGNTTDR